MKGNIFTHGGVPDTGELFDTLCSCGNVLIERIISSDIIPEKEYLQEHDEWVILLEGSALLSIAGASRKMSRGDYLFIPAATPHRVLKTAKGTIWLAVHIHRAGTSITEETSW